MNLGVSVKIKGFFANKLAGNHFCDMIAGDVATDGVSKRFKDEASQLQNAKRVSRWVFMANPWASMPSLT